MRWIKIEIQGDTGDFAVLSRSATRPTIDAQVISPAGDRTDAALASDRDARWNLAVRMQLALDGRRGSPSEIREIHDAINRLAD